MSDTWKYEFEQYELQGTPDRTERSRIWQAAIGLQDVDGLSPSPLLLETARDHIEGKIELPAVQARIQNYYSVRDERQTVEANSKEADLVAAHIAELLSSQSFHFSPAELQYIHRSLFTGVLDRPGQYRAMNLSKREWVLDGQSVLYADWRSIPETLQYDFAQEQSFSYQGLPLTDSLRHIARFIANVWQIHPFIEGNTRTTAVFLLRYLRSFGLTADNRIFAEHSWYFRNALVRASFSDLACNIPETTAYLERFLSNLILGTNYELKNRDLHISVSTLSAPDSQSADASAPKCKHCTLDASLEEIGILRAVAESPAITQKEMAQLLGKSERTVKTLTKTLQEKQLLRRTGGRRSGRWELLVSPGDLF